MFNLIVGMGNISLNISMRNTLLSLQRIGDLQDAVRLRLATGLKVNSAIDNPSSYYAARSLTDRAGDLNSLLDAMSQGIQNLKAVSETIETAAGFLEQGTSLAGKALETDAVPAKEWFERQIGSGGAVVETAQELLDAVNAGKETIVVYGTIRFENQGITLKEGQKLVGTEYFTGSSSGNTQRFSRLEFSNTTTGHSAAIQTIGNNLIAGLDISLTAVNADMSSCIFVNGYKNTIADLSVVGDASNQNRQFVGIQTFGTAFLSGKIDVNVSRATYLIGIYNYSGDMEISSGAEINISAEKGNGLDSIGKTTIHSNAKLNIKAEAAFSCGYSLFDHDQSLIFESDVKINAVSNSLFRIEATTATTNRIIFLNQGIKISWKHPTAVDNQGTWTTNAAWTGKFSSLTRITGTDLDGTAGQGKFTRTANNAEDLPRHWLQKDEPETDRLTEQYNALLDQYDSLIKDGGYKGINLLRGDSLKINFNEDQNACLNISGTDATAQALGLKRADWRTQSSVARSLEEISSALNRLRGLAAEFGNHYNTVSTRQNFTEAMINILEEGADKLTLADMNQESANMLTLRTRQLLAANALSLASQTSRSVLKLF